MIFRCFFRCFFCFSLSFLMFNNCYADEGIQLGATRVIYNSENDMASLEVANSEKIPYLIQSWVSGSADSKIKSKSEFVTTPPLFKLEANSANTIKIRYIGNSLPTDRESVFWLNVNAIPSTKKTDENQLIISLKSQIKLFYRPDNLKGNANLAYQDTKFEEQKGVLIIKNPTPFVVSYNDITINNKTIKENVMVLPFSSKKLATKVNVGQSVNWSAINDYGGITPIVNAKITKNVE